MPSRSLEGTKEPRAYLPTGSWIDYQSGTKYDGGRWHIINRTVFQLRNDPLAGRISGQLRTAAAR